MGDCHEGRLVCAGGKEELWNEVVGGGIVIVWGWGREELTGGGIVAMLGGGAFTMIEAGREFSTLSTGSEATTCKLDETGGMGWNSSLISDFLCTLLPSTSPPISNTSSLNTLPLSISLPTILSALTLPFGTSPTSTPIFSLSPGSSTALTRLSSLPMWMLVLR